MIADALNGIARCRATFALDELGGVDLRLLSAPFGSRVSVQIGYKDSAVEAFNGEATGISARYEAGRQPTFTITALSRLWRMDCAMKQRHFKHMKPSQAARVLLENYGLRAAGIEDFGPELPYWQSINRTDWQTLSDIAERYGRDICCMGAEVYIKRLMTMHKDWHAYEWGKSLISFEAALSSERQIQAHVTLGFDTVSGSGFRGSAQGSSLPLKIGGKRMWSASPMWRDGLTHYEYDGGAIDAAHATELSEAALLERSFKLFTGSAVVEGDPKLKPGATVEMKRVGEQFEGEYIVSHVIHTFSMEGGYITEFGIKRNTLNAGTGRGAALMQASVAPAATALAAAGAVHGDDEDEGGAEVYSLMWRKDGARTEKVAGGEKVVLYCKVKDIADGEKAKFAVYKEGRDEEAVVELEGEVRNGIAEAEWETIIRHAKARARKRPLCR